MRKLVVEHDPDLIKIADHIVDMGPSSGKNGGKIIYQGSFSALKKSTGKTGLYFSEKPVYNRKPRQHEGFLVIENFGNFRVRLNSFCIVSANE